MLYCINNNVIFDPLKHTLTSSKFYPEKDTRLNQPTSRCLSLLIERKGSVITQEDFMNEVWRKHGMEVTVNTLYQNISILRKTLKRVGIDENIIITVPKKGITLSAKVETVADKSFLTTSPHLVLEQQDDIPLNRKGSLSLFLVLWMALLLSLFALWTAFNQ
ncbi:winged helix-turn-helix domain-containing protein [Pantoea alhagi]|uniref:winged helix-turn-helix domain-containing protein n=1 Tax=Pantoea alhagi TaxID=1891675 RepID=UPI00202B0927|nr:winged helix-turn-helix domain-containing protein [Pantoea alhagi]URQ61288.1 winged helix-turn-helix domain-containing protein [Pantoea alhagi]